MRRLLLAIFFLPCCGFSQYEELKFYDALMEYETDSTLEMFWDITPGNYCQIEVHRSYGIKMVPRTGRTLSSKEEKAIRKKKKTQIKKLNEKFGEDWYRNMKKEMIACETEE